MASAVLKYATKPAPMPMKRLLLERFVDGGVTAKLPGPPRTSWREQGLLVGLALFIMGVIILSLIVKFQGWANVLPTARKFLSAAQLHPQSLLAALPLAVYLATIPSRVLHGGRPATVGISPKRVYVESWEGIRHLRILVKREELISVKLVRNPRDMFRRPIGVSIGFRNGKAAVVGRRCNYKEREELAQALNDAIEKTAPKGVPDVKSKSNCDVIYPRTGANQALRGSGAAAVG